MISFSNFLNEANYSQRRSSSIGLEEAIALAKSKCGKNIQSMISNNSFMFRGTYSTPASASDGALILDSDKSSELRKAANAANYSNLIMSNSPTWSDYPRRDKSFICSSSFKYASKYAAGRHAHLIIPFDNTDIGVCPANDIFDSFNIDKFGKQDGISYPDLSYLIRYIGADNLGTRPSENDWNQFKKDMSEFDKFIKDGKMNEVLKTLHSIANLSDAQTAAFKNSITKHGFFETFVEILDPSRNKFKVTTEMKFEDKKELWFSGKAVAFRDSEMTAENVGQWLKDKFK